MSDQPEEMKPSSDSAPDSLINRDEGLNYWQGVNADINGMLGGYPQVSSVDLQGSRAFLARLGLGNPSKGLRRAKRALEGGAGIGRITQGFLVDVAETVDVVEPISKFTAVLDGKSGIGRIFNMGLESWRPQPDDQYDIIWTQWCVGHLTDEQLVVYLRRCCSVLTPETGFIIVKENLSNGDDQFDSVDSSVTRSDRKFKEIFQRAGLQLVRQQIQNGLPRGLFRVMMYALRPSNDTSSGTALSA